ncbi:secreted frizzled-related protein 3-like [Acropora palmata]|uniref:secreted frizzled-related protein 3-like n=1 Tax=Acropora palmata TaxID=6131 RepID=UPI003DA171E7
MAAILVALMLYFVPISFVAGQTGPVDSDSSQQRCEEIQIDLCKSLPFNRTRFPNDFGHTNQSAVNETMWKMARRLNAFICSEDLVFFVCTMYLPICIETQNMPKIIKPCRSVCEKVKEDCLKVLEPSGGTSPFVVFPELPCHNLEYYNQGICLIPDAFIESTKAKPSTATCRETTRNVSETRRQLTEQDILEANFDYGIKGKILSIKRNQNSSTLLFNVSRVLKCSRCGFYAGQVKIKSRTDCPCFKEKECTRLKKGKTYVVLGYRNGNNGLRLKWAWAWPENRHRLSVLKWRRPGRKNSGSD